MEAIKRNLQWRQATEFIKGSCKTSNTDNDEFF